MLSFQFPSLGTSPLDFDTGIRIDEITIWMQSGDTRNLSPMRGEPDLTQMTGLLLTFLLHLLNTPTYSVAPIPPAPANQYPPTVQIEEVPDEDLSVRLYI